MDHCLGLVHETRRSLFKASTIVVKVIKSLIMIYVWLDATKWLLDDASFVNCNKILQKLQIKYR